MYKFELSIEMTMHVLAILGLFKGDCIEILENQYSPFIVTDTGLYNCNGENSNDLIMPLLNGELVWHRRMRLLEKGTIFYYVDIFHDREICKAVWEDSMTDNALLYCGNVFFTAREAEIEFHKVERRFYNFLKEGSGWR